MFELSTRGRYGLQAMVELALRFGAGPVRLGTISKINGISQKYLQQLLAELRDAGLVESIRGARGGYRLARAPDAMNLLEILTALEGPLSLAGERKVGDGQGRLVREVLQEMSQSLQGPLAGVSLDDLRRRSSDGSEMYFI